MIIDVHSHIFCVGLMGEGFDKGTEELRTGLDYAGVGPTPEGWEAMIREVRSTDLDQMARLYLETKSEAKIDKSVVFHVDILGVDGPLSYMEVNRWFAELAQKSRGRVISFAAIDPRRGAEGVKSFERCVMEWGMQGLKLHPVACEFYPNDKKIYPYYAKAEELGVPVILHTGPIGPRKMAYGNPILVDEVAADFRRLKIILAHIADPWIRESIAVTNWKPNVYLDISGSQILYRTEPERFFRLLKVLLRSPARKRVLFATDTLSANSLFVTDEEWVRVIQNIGSSPYASEVEVDPVAVSDLMGGNASELLGIA